MAQTATGKLTEYRVLKRLKDLGLAPVKPFPDRGVDIEVRSPNTPGRTIKIQVKGRNPKKVKTWRWFQVRVTPRKLLEAKGAGLDPEKTWKNELEKVDFFVLDAVKHDEMWVFPKDKIYELINLNEVIYGNRPDNIFNYDKPIKQKQKEMNLDIEVDGEKLTDRFRDYLDNFQLIVDELDHGMKPAWTQKLYIKAIKIAAEAHKKQKLPGSDLPYIIHLAMVSMEIMAALSVEDDLDGDLAIQCALLHDVMEDAGIKFDKVKDKFGIEVADGVKALSKNKSIKSKEEQMIDSLERIKKQPKEIWMVKLADRITNLQPPPSHWDQEKISKYKQEAKVIYDNLKDANKFLADRLRQKIDNYN